VEGEMLGAVGFHILDEVVASGATVDVAVKMRAPMRPGTYTSWWRLCRGGVCFGPKFYVRIVVAGESVVSDICGQWRIVSGGESEYSVGRVFNMFCLYGNEGCLDVDPLAVPDDVLDGRFAVLRKPEYPAEHWEYELIGFEKMEFVENCENWAASSKPIPLPVPTPDGKPLSIADILTPEDYEQLLSLLQSAVDGNKCLYAILGWLAQASSQSGFFVVTPEEAQDCAMALDSIVKLLSKYIKRVDVPGDPLGARIVALHSGLCLDIADSSTEGGARAVQRPCKGLASQLWTFQRIGDNFRIVSKHSGKCLDVYGASLDNGTPVIQWYCHEGDNQMWKLRWRGDDYAEIVSLKSGKCLDVREESLEEGAQIIQWECHDAGNQMWRFR